MSKKPKNPVSGKKGSNRVVRSGNWYYYSFGLHSAQRDFYGPSTRYNNNGGGFRIVKNTPKEKK